MKRLFLGIMTGIVLAVLFSGCLSGCALFDKSNKTDSTIPGMIALGDGKFLGIDLAGNMKQVFDILPSCNADGKLTANCIIGCVDGISGNQSTIDPVDKATQDAIKTLGLSLASDEEYQCCKAMGIAGSYLVNKYGGTLGGMASLLRLGK